MVERPFLRVPRGCLRFVIVVFPDHTRLLFVMVVIIAPDQQACILQLHPTIRQDGNKKSTACRYLTKFFRLLLKLMHCTSSIKGIFSIYFFVYLFFFGGGGSY